MLSNWDNITDQTKNRLMKILNVSHTFLPDYYGGTEVLVSNLSKKMSESHEVHVFYANPVSSNPDYSINEGKIGKYTTWELQKDIRNNISFEQEYFDENVEIAFKALIEKIKPDVIHFHHLLYLSYNLPKIAHENGIPVFLTFHDFWFQCFSIKRVDLSGKSCDTIDVKKCASCMQRKKPLSSTQKVLLNKVKNQWLLKKLRVAHFRKAQLENFFKRYRAVTEINKRNESLRDVFKYCDRIYAPTTYLYEEFKKWGIGDKMIYSADGIDNTFLSDISKKESSNFRFAFIGAITSEKGLHVLIDAFNKFNEDGVSLYVFGDLYKDKNYGKTIANSAKKNKNIIFKGTFPPEDVAKVFQEIDCLIMPSIWAENSPLVVKNALMTRTPVIASRIPGVKDDINDNENGLLFKMGSSDELVLQMKKILDKNLYLKIKNNIKAIKTIDDNVNELLIAYKEIIDKNK